jgi:hypothetical protein
MRKCILHAGSPKTGTTSIQYVLRKDRKRFVQHGILVPQSGQGSGGAHRALAYKLAGLPVPPEDDGAEQAFVRELSASPAETVLISSEFLSRILCHPRQGGRLLGRLRSLGLDVTVLIYVRNQTQFLNSSYAQAVKSFRQGGEFAGFVRRAIDSSRKHSYSRWVAFSGAHQVPVLARPFSEAVRRNGVIEDFLRTVGVASARGFDTAVALNNSVGPFSVAVARSLLGRIGGPERLSKMQASRCRAALLAALETAGIEDRGYCGLTAELAREIERAFAADNDVFARFAWGKSWGEVFASEMGLRFEPNDYSVAGVQAEYRPLFDSVLARLEREIDEVLADGALQVAADYNGRRGARQRRRSAGRAVA